MVTIKMPDIMEIIQDLNVSIADMETLKSTINDTNSRSNLSKAIGQLKAARGCLICIVKEVA